MKQEHCSHECVCGIYNGTQQWFDKSPCVKDCPHDTRARPAAIDPDAELMAEMIMEELNELRKEKEVLEKILKFCKEKRSISESEFHKGERSIIDWITFTASHLRQQQPREHQQ